MNSNPSRQQIDGLLALYDQGKFGEAASLASTLLRSYPNALTLYNIAGAANMSLGRFDLALGSFDQALRLKPDFADAHYFRGNALKALDRADEALASYDAALRLKPDLAGAHNNRGGVLRKLDRLGEALASYDEVVRLRPDLADAHYNRGNALKDMGRLEEALASYAEALRLAPDLTEAYNNRGNVLKDLGKPEEALASYDAALRLAPDLAGAHNNRGSVLQDLNRRDEALASYDAALRLAPGLADAHNNRGSVLQDLDRLDDALVSYDRALALDPDLADAHSNRGISLQGLKRFDEALASYATAVRLEPGFGVALGQMLHLKAQICDWSDPGPACEPARLGIDGEGIPPFFMLAIDDDPSRQLERAKTWSKLRQRAVPQAISRPSARPERLRVGYFSADFHEHATMYLMARMFELHDKQRFETHAFSFGPDQHDTMRRRLIGSIDRFHDVRHLSDRGIAELARSEAIDIAIDLKGYTRDSRPNIFAHRAAPVQIAYMGFPGSLGSEHIDYIVADPIVLPPDARRFYAEKVISLPHTYWATDDRCEISARAFARAEVGLPEHGFVFCCLNNNYKISPAEFDVWMRILSKVTGSVLWLLEDNHWAKANLRREAEARGIDPDRLVFAARMPLADHLARHRCADLFLDTFNCNAHTTASDALWTGLPVVTKPGKSFSARVAASLLHAVGLPELVASSVEAYEQLALDLANHPDRLEAIRAKLAANRLTTPLFDSEGFTRAIERGYELAYERYYDGLPPDHIHVSAA